MIFLFRREDDHFSVLVDFQPVCPARRASSVCRQAENPPKLKSQHLRGEIKKYLSKRFCLNFQNSSNYALATPSNWKISSECLNSLSDRPIGVGTICVWNFCWTEQIYRILEFKIENNEFWKYTFLFPVLCLVVADVSGESRNVLERFYDDLGSK